MKDLGKANCLKLSTKDWRFYERLKGWHTGDLLAAIRARGEVK